MRCSSSAAIRARAAPVPTRAVPLLTCAARLPIRDAAIPCRDVAIPVRAVPLPCCCNVQSPTRIVLIPTCGVPLPVHDAPIEIRNVLSPTRIAPIPTRRVPLPTRRVPLPTRDVPLPTRAIPLPSRDRKGAVIFLFLLLSAALAAAAPPQALPAAGADLAKLIRSAGLDPTECYRVRDLSFFKEDIKFYFNEGFLIFSKPVNGERISAAFSAAVEGGDGEVLLLPPYRGERQSLAKFTQSPNMDEHFNAALLVFSDGSAQALLDRIVRENLGRKVPEIGPLLVDQWSAVLSNLVSGFELRLVQDLLTPQPTRRGLVFAAIAGRQLGNFDLLYNGGAREQILAGQLGERNGRPAYDIWTNFEARSSRAATAIAPDPSFTTNNFRIDAALDSNLRMKATVHAAVKVGANAIRGLPFAISRAMQVTAARVDGAPAELLFLDSARGQALRYVENDPFLLLPADGLSAASVHQIEFDEEGSVISPAGNDVYFVGARSNWYPRSDGDFATYDLTFRYPKRLTLLTPGDVTEDRVEGDWRITRRVTAAPIRMAGFNLGAYQKVVGVSPGFHVEVYGNKGSKLRSNLNRMRQSVNPVVNTEAIARFPNRGRRPNPVLPNATVPDPLARLRAVSADVSSALQFFSGLFGPPVLNSLTVSPIPGGFGQSFPGWLSFDPVLSRCERASSLRRAARATRYSIRICWTPMRWRTSGGEAWSSRPAIRTSGSAKRWLTIRPCYISKKKGRLL